MAHAALINEYRRVRLGRSSRRLKPSAAIAVARKAIADGKPSPIGYSSFFPCATVGAPWKSGSTTLRWTEKPSAVGLRFVGYADKLASLRHEGWFTDDDGMSGETMRGVVFQLPGKNGRARFVAGYQDPCNGSADNNGPCAISFDEIFEESGDVRADSDHYGAHRDCALRADSIAEWTAEEERDNNRAASARNQFDELGDEVAKHRRDCLALIREIKANGKAFGDAICAALRSHVESHIRDIQKARAKREELALSFDHCDGWKS